jgi:hypothetical protein
MWMGEWVERRASGWAGRQKGKQASGWAGGWAEGWMGEQMGGRAEGQTGKWVSGRVDGRAEAQASEWELCGWLQFLWDESSMQDRGKKEHNAPLWLKSNMRRATAIQPEESGGNPTIVVALWMTQSCCMSFSGTDTQREKSADYIIHPTYAVPKHKYQESGKLGWIKRSWPWLGSFLCSFCSIFFRRFFWK